jgi:SAM-dependent methyltransferase
MTDQPGWTPPGADAPPANAARVYDYGLGGQHSFLPDQDVARAIAALEASAPAIGQAARAFLGRAVRFLAGSGVRQFLDIGCGIPAEPNVHEIAAETAPDSRVVYVDHDPVVVAHTRARLEGIGTTTVFQADLRDPAAILGHQEARRMLVPGQPTGLLLLSVLHFLADRDDPWQVVATLRDALAPGSYLVLSHGTDEGNPRIARAIEKLYQSRVATPLHLRPRAGISRFFTGFRLLDPGLVYLPQWRPAAPADVPADPARYGNLAGVARRD